MHWKRLLFFLCKNGFQQYLCKPCLLYTSVKRILKPFYDLKRTANIISAGKYEERAKICAKDEIGEVSESFNKMAEKVQDHIKEPVSYTHLLQNKLQM